MSLLFLRPVLIATDERSESPEIMEISREAETFRAPGDSPTDSHATFLGGVSVFVEVDYFGGLWGSWDRYGSKIHLRVSPSCPECGGVCGESAKRFQRVGPGGGPVFAEFEPPKPKGSHFKGSPESSKTHPGPDPSKKWAQVGGSPFSSIFGIYRIRSEK